MKYKLNNINMSSKNKNTEELKKDFFSKENDYKILGENIKMNLESLLNTNKIDYLSVNTRVKNIDSFLEKLNRKEYANPTEEIEDICWVRIICYYVTDLKTIDDIIEKNFNIVEKIYKESELWDEKFGYRSNHYIVTLKKEWCKIPTLKWLEDKKAEIQVRTILMHAWADVSHKLNYKSENDSPLKLRRKLNQLSALFEIADNYFVEIKELKSEYIKDTRENLNLNNKTIEENIDSLQVILDLYFPNRWKGWKELNTAFNELKKYNINLQNFDKHINKIWLENILKIEDDLFWHNNYLQQVWIIRLILDIVNNDFFNSRFENKNSWYPKKIISWRKKLWLETNI